MNLDTSGIILVLVFGVFVLLSMYVAKLFFASLFGVTIAELPIGLKFLTHLAGAAIILFVFKKIFVH